MSRLLRYILPVLALALFSACSGNAGQDAEEEVPEGVLRIFADKTRISADGNEEVTFTVKFGSEDVSNTKTLQIIRKYDGEEKYMSYGVNRFSTVTAGTYEFSAKYYYQGNNYSDNSVKVVAEPFFSGEEKSYAQRVLGTYFTSTGCVSCPSASNGIKALQEAEPGMISLVAFHSDLGPSADPMTVPETAQFNAAFGGFEGLPRLFWNMRADTELIGPLFTDSYQEEKDSYEPICGVAIETVLDEMASSLKVDVAISSNRPAVCRYLVFLVEDGIIADQMGSNIEDYVHNNVVRKVLTGTSGDKLNDNLPLTVGVEAKASKTVTLDSRWNKDNLRVVVAAMMSDDGGYTWVANNVNECAAGESVSYIYSTEE